MLVVPDVGDMFVPLSEGFLVNPETSQYGAYFFSFCSFFLSSLFVEGRKKNDFANL